jgi:hypothetical protein
VTRSSSATHPLTPQRLYRLTALGPDHIGEGERGQHLPIFHQIDDGLASLTPGLSLRGY